MARVAKGCLCIMAEQILHGAYQFKSIKEEFFFSHIFAKI